MQKKMNARDDVLNLQRPEHKVSREKEGRAREHTEP